MKREIKFRARDESGAWRYGSLRHDLGEWFIYENDKHKVEGETIGQFTGLLDRKRIEIYEGDIILYQLDSGEKLNLEVKFLDGRFSPFGQGGVYPQDCWVIGNIYENHELLI